MTLTRRATASASARSSSSARRSTSRSSSRAMRARGRRARSAHVAPGAASPPARTARSAPAVAQAAASAAPRASCSTCATTAAGCSTRRVLVASIFLPEGTIVSTKGRARPERVYEATGDADRAEAPGRRARRPRLRVGVGDRHRRAAGPQARDGRRHAHVRQGRLPGDRASSPTAARSTSPSASTSRPAGRNLGGGGVAQGRGHRARRPGPRRPEDQAATRRSTRPSAWPARRRVKRRAAAAGPPPHGGPVVAVLERRGRFLDRRAVLRRAGGA